jgi:hypothetical protein
MRRGVLLLLEFFLACQIGLLWSQPDLNNIGRIDNNRFVLTIDLRWDLSKIEEIARSFDIDSSIIQAIRRSRFESLSDSVWTVVSEGDNLVVLSRPVARIEYKVQGPHEFILLDDPELLPPPPPPLPEVVCGANDPGLLTVFESDSGYTTFLLKGYRKARRVILSGSFNQWSTLSMEMSRIGEAWVYRIKLPAGKYLYKFIVDGKWLSDPGNRNKERDGHGGFNSVYYKSNYLFRLDGYKKAKKVVVTGSFNGWNRREFQMIRTPDGWALPLFLRDGTWAYKFIVDQEWITDPSNPDLRHDGFGNANSFISLGDPYIFFLAGFTDASRVILSGSFNNWDHNELVMQKQDYGWLLPVVLIPGNHEYKFIVDGKWITDPANPLTTGHGDFMNSLITIKPNYEFHLAGFDFAETVIVTGTFNNWNTKEYKMIRNESGWYFPIWLKPGKYLYKFFIDGQWYIDPGNEWWEENEFGTGNSVLWVE